MNKIFNTALILLILIGLTNCEVTKGFKYLSQKKVEVFSYRNGAKSISFVSNHHMGKTQYYENLEAVVKYYKSKDYIIFYEGIIKSELTDSILIDIEQRKFRKFLGFLPKSEIYDSVSNNYKLLKKFVPQPKKEELGIDTSDVQVDVSVTKLIEEYETKYWEVPLDSIDMNTPINQNTNRNWYMNDFMKIAIDSRNENLAEKILTLPYNKILIIYGATHRKRTFEILKNKDVNWEKINKVFYNKRRIKRLNCG